MKLMNGDVDSSTNVAGQHTPGHSPGNTDYMGGDSDTGFQHRYPQQRGGKVVRVKKEAAADKITTDQSSITTTIYADWWQEVGGQRRRGGGA